LEIIQTALLHNNQVQIQYFGNNLKESELVLSPLGLIVRGAITYLVATAFEYQDVRLYAFHRIKSAIPLFDSAQRPKGFDLSQYIDDGAMQFGGGTPIALTAIVSSSLARILTETPMSTDQKTINVKEGLRISATVIDSWQLRWWILSMGDNIKVLKPARLSKEIYSTLKKAADQYE
jgi:predicted DNA-binding transcriptional regulator YafY